MKAMFAKALVLTLALALVLSGCNLVEVNYELRADRDIAEIDKDYAATVASYDGGEVTVGEAVGEFNTTYAQTAYMYSYFGIEMGHDQVHEILESTLEQHVRSEVAAAHYDAEYSLSDEKLSELESTAQSDAEANFDSMRGSAAGENDEEIDANTRVLLRSNGMDYDSVYASALLNAKYVAMQDVLRDEIAELSDDELQEAYDAKVEEQQASFIDGRSYENAMTGTDTIVCWVPDGYRTVKHILVKPADEIMTAYTDAVSALSTAQGSLTSLEDELESANGGDDAEDAEATEDAEAEDTADTGRSAEEIQADIDEAQANVESCQADVESAAQACLDDVKETTDAIYERLEAGDSFDDLIAEYGEDPGMQSEPTMTSGYYVSSESQSWEVNFRDAAMALEQVGDYTAEPVVSGSGVHIIEYTGDVLGGEVPLEDVHDALYDEALETAKQNHVIETFDAWVEEVNPTYDVDAFEAAISGTEE